MEELVLQLTEISGVPVDTARDILENVDWDLQRAIDLILQDTIPEPAPKITTPKRSPPVKKVNTKVIQSPPKEKLVTAGTNERFAAMRNQADERNKWMLVVLTKKHQMMPIFRELAVRDYMNMRFVGLDLDMEESDGQWFYHTYSIERVPVFAVIDPVTSECKRMFYGDMTPIELYKWLDQFVKDFPEKGGQWIVLEDLTPEISSSSSDTSDSDTAEEEVREEPAVMLTFMVEYPNGKRSRLEIGDNEKVKNLYKKIGQVMERNPNTFKLTVVMGSDLDDQTKVLKELNCNRALIRVIDV